MPVFDKTIYSLKFIDTENDYDPSNCYQIGEFNQYYAFNLTHYIWRLIADYYP